MNYFTEIKIVLETVPEESSRSASLEGSNTPPPYPINYVDCLENNERSTSFIYHGSENSSPQLSIPADKEIRSCESLPPNFEKMANLFNMQQKKGTIDVWWLYDDGGEKKTFNL